MKKIKIILKRIVPNAIWNKLKVYKELHGACMMKRKSKKVKAFQPDSYPCGVNLIGDIRAETGLGQSMRIVAGLLECAHISFLVNQIDVPGNMEHKERQWDHKIEEHNRYGINLLHINNSIWERSYNQIPLCELSRHYNIAYWLWELEEFPEEWMSCIDTVDEIWTPAEFVSESIRKKTNKPVLTMPYGMELDMDHLLERSYFGLPEGMFLFLMMYDFHSVNERKNPRGVIEAYKCAFDGKEEGIGLVLKINHLAEPKELEELKRELDGYSNLFFITDNMNRNEVESLIAAADVLISLHRAEGFGLPLAEAMYLGTAVIATNWSASAEFMNEECACLVDYKLALLKEDIGPYRKGSRWADADIGQAAEYMKQLVENKEFFSNKVNAGKQYIRKYLDRNKMAAKMSDRIKDIYARGNQKN